MTVIPRNTTWGAAAETIEQLVEDVEAKADEALSGSVKYRTLLETDDFHALESGGYLVVTGTVATALGLPEAVHGVLRVQRWSSGWGLAVFETRTEPSRTYTYVWGSGGAPGAGWMRSSVLPSEVPAPYQKGIATSTVPMDSLPNGLYHVTTSAVATYLGLPEIVHGVLRIERWGSGNGIAIFETRSEPVRVWSLIWSGSTAGTWQRVSVDQSTIRTVRVAVDTDVFEDLPTGDYQVGLTSTAAALGLPVLKHGILRIDRWGAEPKTGLATFTTREEPSQIWSYIWNPDGSSDGWHLVTDHSVAETVATDYAIRHQHLRTRHEARIGAPIDVGTATPVAFVWDDYPADMRDKGVIEWAEEYEVPITFAACSRMLDPEYAERLGGVGITWAEIDAWVQGGWVELANHGATHDPYRTEAEMYDEIVTGLAELQAHSPSKPITTWAMPDNSWPGFDNGYTADQWAGPTGQLILGHHAYATGKDPVLPDRTQPMTGRAIQGQDRKWVESTDLNETTRKGIITSLYGTDRGVIISAHAKHIDAPGRWTSAEVEAFFAWLAAEQTAGRVRLMFLSEWPWARVTPGA